MHIKKISQNFCAIACNISLLLNSFLPYFAAVPVRAEEPISTPIVESTPAPIADPTIAPTDTPAEPTIEPTAIPTEEPTPTPIITETPTVTPIITETPTVTPVITVNPTTTPEVTVAPAVIGVNEVNTPAENNNNNNQSSGDNSSPAAPTPTFMIPSPTPTPSPRVVEQVCSTKETSVRDSVELDWNYDAANDMYVTREKVQLGVKYIFPKENNVTVTFTSLPKDELYRSYLKIKQVKTSDIKLPENVGNVGEYAYDITTDMFDGEFKYDITFPKNSDQTAEISYIEKTLEQAKTGVTASEINSVDESKVEQQNNSVKATSVDHFTLFIVTYADSSLTTQKYSYTQGENVYVKLLNPFYFSSRIVFRNNNGTVVKNCPVVDGHFISCSYTLLSSDSIGTWSATYEQEIFGSYLKIDSTNFEVLSQNCNYVCPTKTFATSRSIIDVPAHYADCTAGTSNIDGKTCRIAAVYGIRYANRIFFGICPIFDSFYTSTDSSKHCHKSVIIVDAYNINRTYIPTTYKTETFEKAVFYEKSVVANECNRPSANSLNVPSWAVDNFNKLNASENYIVTAFDGYYLDNGVCRQKVGVCTDQKALNHHSTLGTNEKEDNSTCTYTPAEECPTTCGYPGSTTSIPNGQGGYRTCLATADCYTPVCGNGVLDSNEQCDDGNKIDEDGCSSNCQIENKVTICHEISSESNQFNKTTIAESAVINAHINHHDVGDIIPTFTYGGHTYFQNWPSGQATWNNNCVVPIRTASISVVKRFSKESDADQSTFPISINGNGQITGLNTGSISAGTSVTFIVTPGTYSVTEIIPSGWKQDLNGCDSVTLGLSVGDYTVWDGVCNIYNSKILTPVCGNGKIDASVNEQCDDGNTTEGDGCSSTCQNEPIKIYAQKVICDAENYLPNNTQGNITALTAQNWVDHSNGHCRIVNDWNFQFGGVGSYGTFQTNTNSLAGWQTITTTSGLATATINDISLYGSKIEFREVFPDNTYVPFSNSSNNVSAEIYCTDDAANYDNWEWINNPQYGHSYYCVAFNALKLGHLTVQKTTYPAGDESNFSVTASGNGSINGSATGTVNNSTDKTYEMTSGIYSVIETVPKDWEQISNNCTDVTVNAGQTPTCEIVNRKLGQINVTKFNDLNGNGLQDEGEDSMSGWTINLSSKDSKVTSENGSVTFDQLISNTYTLSEDITEGWTQTGITCTGTQPTPTPTRSPELTNLFVKSVNAAYKEIPAGSKEVTVNAGDNINCKIGNRLITPTATISKSNDASGSLSPGSSVNYKIKIKISDNDVTDFNVTDLLSNGFKYRPGSYSVIKNTTNNITVGTSEPQYHSPGVWHLGDLKAGDELVLSYTADISTDQQPGEYTDLALAKGNAKYESTIVYAQGENSSYVNNNFVGTDVSVVKSTQNSISAGVESSRETKSGDVLGASTELPSTGSSTSWLIICALMSLLGFTLIKKSKKMLSVLFFAAFFLFPSNAHAAVGNLQVRLEKPKTPINTSNVELNFVAMNIDQNFITVKCFKKYSTEATFSKFGADISSPNAGYNASHCSLSPVLIAEGSYQFYVEANGVNSNTVAMDYKTSGPGTPNDYRKDHPNNCDYKIHFKTADDAGKTVKVEVYRADVTNFILDDGSVVSTVSVGSNEERDVTNSVPDCNKNYYYVIRAFDNAGNGSGPVGDSVVTSTITTATTTTAGTTVKTGTSAIPVVNVTLAPGEENATNTVTSTPVDTTGGGTVLGTTQTAKNFIQKYWLYLILALVIIVLIIRYVLQKKKSPGR